jgi:hypothetical protein
MKKYIILLIVSIPLFALSQGGLGIGIKGGLNFANITKVSSINNSSRTGFHAGLFLAPNTGGIIGSRTEVIFSRQGYNYKTSTNTGNVDLNYIMLPQYMTINITKYFQIQLGGQMAYLLNAKTDSTKKTSPIGGTSPSPLAGTGYEKAMDYYNRFDFGYGGGIEIHPVAGLLIGARVNISLGNLYKEPEAGQQPSFFPKVDVKNNVFQVFAGWTFGKKDAKKEKKKSKEKEK